MTPLIIIGVGIFLIELLIARASTHEKSALVFGVISSTLTVLCVVLLLVAIYELKGWDGLALLPLIVLIYGFAVLNGLAGLRNWFSAAFDDPDRNRNRVRMALILNGIAFIPLIWMAIVRVF